MKVHERKRKTLRICPTMCRGENVRNGIQVTTLTRATVQLLRKQEACALMCVCPRETKSRKALEL